MKRATLALLLCLCAAAAAHADGFYDKLLDPHGTWTYDVVNAKTDKKVGDLTIVVTRVEKKEKLSIIDLSSTAAKDPARWTLLIGPDGLREVVLDAPNDEDPRSEANLRRLYHELYMPRLYLPAKLAAGRFRAKLDRFSVSAAVYDLVGELSKRDHDTWRMTWTGTFTDPGGEVQPHTFTSDYDPRVGFTRMCGSIRPCLRLAKP